MAGDGLIPKTKDFNGSIQWADVIVFDTSSGTLPKEAEFLRGKGVKIIGTSEYAARLEADRPFSLEIAKRLGIRVPLYESFKGLGAFEKARSFLEKHQDRENGWVFKPDNVHLKGVDTTIADDFEEMIRMLAYIEDRFKKENTPERAVFVIEAKHEGIEVSTEAWFNGESWSAPNGTLERKRILNDDLGEICGCSGNVVWIYRNDSSLFDRLLKPMTALLKGKYVGPLDVNCIIDKELNEPVFLEFSPRFGYAAIFGLAELVSDLGRLLYEIANGRDYHSVKADNFSCGVRAWIPPYPEFIKEDPKLAVGTPVFGFNPESFIDGVYPSELMITQDGVETSGPFGMLFDVVGRGTSIEAARSNCYAKFDRIRVPDLGYRTDIGIKAIEDYRRLIDSGWIDRESIF